MKVTITLDDGTTKDFIEAVGVVAEAEVAKVEAEVAAVDTELKADEATA